jgi:superfamily II RNA helicase
VGNWDDFQAVPDEFLDAGERVVVLGHFQGRGKASGKTLDALYAHGWTLRKMGRRYISAPTQTQPRFYSRPVKPLSVRPGF